MSWEDIIKEERQGETLRDIVHDILFGYLDGKGERKKEYVIDRDLLHAIWGELK